MEKIPAEIISNIIGRLHAPLAPYSTISRDWQCHVEALTMSELQVRSDEPGRLDMVFQDARRRRLLKKLQYKIVLPSYSAKRWSKVPGVRERLRNNIAFTQELRNLFVKLYTYDKEDQRCPDSATPFCLALAVSCPMDSYIPPITQNHTEGTGIYRNMNEFICFDPKEQEPLPILTKITEFHTPSQRQMHSAILGLVLRSLPAVQKVYWPTSGPDVRLLDLRRELRTSLADILLNTSLSSLRELHLYWMDAQCSNQSFHAGSLLNRDTGIDELSVALRRIAQLPNIKKLKLGGLFLVSHEFFISPDDDGLGASWPSLEVLELHLSSMTPAGDWYFTGDRSIADMSEERATPSDEEDELYSSDSEVEDSPAVSRWKKLNGETPYCAWRRQPDTPLESFLLALAKSVPKMPALRMLTFEMGFGAELIIDMEYRSAGVDTMGMRSFSGPPDTYDSPHWEVLLHLPSKGWREKVDWEIPEELIQAWKHTAGIYGSIDIVNGGERVGL